MTLSNFDWTDKNSVKWFILLPTGHEGPYSLNQLLKLNESGKISANVSIWTEGLASPVVLSQLGPAMTPSEEELPPLPEENIPPLPTEEVPVRKAARSPLLNKWLILPVLALALIFFIVMNYASVREENFKVHRLPKMSLELHERILAENSFKGWNAPLFLKEYLPDDHSLIWLVTSSFHECDIETHFQSVKDKLLSKDDQKITFRAHGFLKDHIVELSRFEFLSGSRMVPGLYEMDVKATNCRWDGLFSTLMNQFTPPSEEYLARTKVVLFAQGPVEFNKVLERLLKEKLELQLKEQNQNEIFWQDLQQKFETLQAIALQIEQLMIDHMEAGPRKFHKDLNKMVDEYTKKYGSFLTSFVVENENYFNSLSGEAKGASMKRNYELMVRLASKKLGLESMKFIEEFQAMKTRPSKKELSDIQERVKKVFASLKDELNEKLLQVEKDRSS